MILFRLAVLMGLLCVAGFLFLYYEVAVQILLQQNESALQNETSKLMDDATMERHQLELKAISRRRRQEELLLFAQAERERMEQQDRENKSSSNNSSSSSSNINNNNASHPPSVAPTTLGASDNNNNNNTETTESPSLSINDTAKFINRNESVSSPGYSETSSPALNSTNETIILGLSNASVASSPMPEADHNHTVQQQEPPTPNLQNDNNDPRPTGLRLFILGDSLSRYQHISLTYFLRTGRWITPDTDPNPVNEKTYKDWERFYSETTVNGFEICDCYRKRGDFETNIENRYFYEPSRDNMVVYAQCFFKMRGREDPAMVMAKVNNRSEYVFHNNKTNNLTWEYSDWADTIKYHAAKLAPKPQYALLNGGIWQNAFRDKDTRERLIRALNETGISGIWRTTTYQRDHSLPLNAEADPLVQELFRKSGHRVLDASWTENLDAAHYWDPLHFLEPVYRVMSEDLLSLIGYEFPSGYERFDKKSLENKNITNEKS